MMNAWKIIAPAVISLCGIFLCAVTENTALPDTLTEQLMNLKNRLALDELQTAKVQEILKNDLLVASKNRETFINNARDLIKAAYDRKKEKESRIAEVLNAVQQEKYKEIVKMTHFDRELFELSEGLVLNDEQVFNLEGILINYENKRKEMIPEELRSNDGPPIGPMSIPGKRTGSYPEFGPLKSMIKSLENKKNKSIRKILTPGQKKLFEQILKYRSEVRNKERAEERY